MHLFTMTILCTQHFVIKGQVGDCDRVFLGFADAESEPIASQSEQSCGFSTDRRIRPRSALASLKKWRCGGRSAAVDVLRASSWVCARARTEGLGGDARAYERSGFARVGGVELAQSSPVRRPALGAITSGSRVSRGASCGANPLSEAEIMMNSELTPSRTRSHFVSRRAGPTPDRPPARRSQLRGDPFTVGGH